MELEQLEQRQITIALPSEVWEILDGGNKLAQAAGAQGLEEWIASMVLRFVLQCLRLTMPGLCDSTSPTRCTSNQEGNA